VSISLQLTSTVTVSPSTAASVCWPRHEGGWRSAQQVATAAAWGACPVAALRFAHSRSTVNMLEGAQAQPSRLQPCRMQSSGFDG
jgi:hypothetical protein